MSNSELASIGNPDEGLKAEVIQPLTDEQKADHARLEAVVDRSLAMFSEVAQALCEINEKEYYLQSHTSFAAYVRDKWDHGERWAYRMLDAHKVARNLSPMSITTLPSEWALRPLAKLAPDTQREAWAEAAKNNPKPKRGDIERAVAKVAPESVKLKPELRVVDDQEDVVATNPPTVKMHPIEAGVAMMKREGYIPEGAEVYISDPDNSPPEEAGEQEGTVDSELSDADWLKTLPARDRLADHIRERFDADALAFRQATAIRLKFSRALKPITNAAKKKVHGNIGNWMDRMSWVLRTNDPPRWKPCLECKGSGSQQMIGSCPNCKGHGYHI